MGTTQSGGALLRYLSQRCDEELAAGRGEETPEEPMILEFTVRTHDQAARQVLLHEMRLFTKTNAAVRVQPIYLA